MIGVTLAAVVLNFVFHVADWQHVRHWLFAERYLRMHRALHKEIMKTGWQINQAAKQLENFNNQAMVAGETGQKFDMEREAVWLISYCREFTRALLKQLKADHRALRRFPSECNKKRTICPKRHNRWEDIYNDTFKLLHELELQRVLSMGSRR
jgi:hypothetical protein